MSVSGVRQWTYRCDWCKREERAEQRPAWLGRIHVTDCGLTHYTRDDDVCLDCIAKKGLTNGQSI